MFIKKTFYPLSVLTTSLLFANVAIADTSLTFTDSSPKGDTRSSTIQIHGSKVRTSESGSTIYTLYDTEKETMYTINPEAKQYMQANIEIIKKNMAAAIEMQEKMKAQMKEKVSKMPEEQRKTIEKKINDAEKKAKQTLPKITIVPNGKTDTVQGLNCKVSTISADNKAIKDTCIATEGFNKEDIAQLKKMFAFMENIAVETAKIRNIPAPDASTMPSHQEGLAIKIQALPTGIKSELTKLSTDALDDKDFTVPEAYTLIDPKMATPAKQQDAPAKETQK